MLIKTKNKWDASEAFINTWLKDQRKYCNHCGQDYDLLFFPCCENPQVGRNIDHTRGLLKQNRELQKTRLNEYASTENKSIRWGLSLPPKLYMDLDRYFKKLYNEKLFEDNGEMRQFMKRFKNFSIPERV